MKRNVFTVLIVATAILSATGCKKKEKEEVVVDHALTAVTVNDLENGGYYVKAGDNFYYAPVEDKSFNPNDPQGTRIEFIASKDSETGLEDPEANHRVLAFTNWDNAIPTLYKNDQLIYKSSSGDVSNFTWERFIDEGYSIGVSGLKANGAGKIVSKEGTMYYAAGTAYQQLSQLEIPANTDVIIDSMNGTPLNNTYLSDAGTITGLSKDASIQANVFIGTTPQQVMMNADTRLFKSTEMYKTTNFELSANGYAIVKIPDYFKSGYYLINNVGFIKYIAVDRGNDESSISLDTPYYYVDEGGNLLTYYEWADKNGMATSELHDNSKSFNESELSINPDDYEEQASVTLDSTQENITAVIRYKYKDAGSEDNAVRNGIFPHAVLVKPDGTTKLFEQDDTLKKDQNDSYVYLRAESDTAPAGDYYVLYTNFDNIIKSLNMNYVSGNADSYIHNGKDGRVSIYFEGSDAPHNISLKWEKNDRALTDIVIEAPDGTEYSMTKTPDNIIVNEAGKFTIKVPYMAAGEYTFRVKGDQLGRVWISTEESVTTVDELIGGDAVPETNADGTPVETEEEPETNADGTPVETTDSEIKVNK